MMTAPKMTATKMTAPNRYSAQQALEQAFFRDIDSMIMNRLCAESHTKDARRALMKEAGLRDKLLIEELTELGVTPEGIIAMRLVPLVLVAWADHRVDRAEWATVDAEALRMGIADGSVASVILHHWLKTRPPATIFDAWKRYIRTELAAMSPKAKTKLTALMKKQMTEMAEASGGHFGMAKTSSKEKQVIEMVVTALRM